MCKEVGRSKHPIAFLPCYSSFDSHTAMATLTQSPHDITLPTFQKKDVVVPEKEIVSPERIARKWITSFESALVSGNANDLKNLLVDDSWWRDQLILEWDFNTKRGAQKITDFVADKLPKIGFSNFALQKDGKFAPNAQQPIEGLEWIESLFSFETKVGCGKGVFRLVCLNNGVWKAHMIHTALTELKGFKEIAGYHRPHGGNNSLKGGAVEGNWYERRERQKDFLDEEPTVLVIGAGQSGLNMGARLQALGLSCLIIDKNERVGDNWRHRYRTLVTHDPVQYTHMVRNVVAASQLKQTCVD
jgi:hypothetical protein